MIRKSKIVIILMVMLLIIAISSVVHGKTLPKERQIRTLEYVSMPAGEDLPEYRGAVLYANELRELGLDVIHHAMPYSTEMNYIWAKRDSWDLTSWWFGARPERSDPDELIYNSFISTNTEKGYNFEGYENPEMDRLLNLQRLAFDPEKRQEYVYKIQELIAEDVPLVFMVHRSENFAYNKKLWDPNSIVHQDGIGIRNYWTITNMKPLTEMKDVIANYSESIRTINPFNISGIADVWNTELIFDRLLRIGPDGLPKPAAAREVKWLDNVTLEVTLRSGMKFHDGKPVTTEDVVFTFDACKSGEAPRYEPFATLVKSIEVSSKDKMIFHLKNPNAAFLITSLAKINIVPKHIWGPIIEELKKKSEDVTMYQREIPIGSGPFRFVSWKKGEEVVLEAVKDHYNAPKIDRLIWRNVQMPEVQLGQLKNWELNFLTDYRGDPSILKKVVEDNDDYLTWENCITIGIRFVAFNLRRPPFNDKAFRKALAYAAPRKKICDVVEFGFTTAADSIVSKELKYWHNPKLPQYEYNIEKARQVLASAGYEWNEKGRLCYPEGKKETLNPAWGP